MTWDRRTLLVGAAASLGAAPALAAVAPKRIVSLNACMDVMLVHLADRNQIAALSHYSQEAEGSTIAQVAHTLPFIWESAEEVLALRPDLVLSSLHSAPATRNALARLHVPAERFAVPKSVAESLRQVRKIAGLIGRPERGADLIQRIEAALQAARPPQGARPITALVFQPNGLSPGPGTLTDELMTRTGFENVARRYGLRTWGNVPLERLIADPPEVLLVGEPAPGGGRNWADRVMTHPALRGLSGRMRQATLPEKLIYCGGPVLIDFAATLARTRQHLSEGQA